MSFEKIKDIDLFEIVWPEFTLVTDDIVKLKKTIKHNQIENFFFQVEEFWVNNNFKSSPEEISKFFYKTLRRR